MSTFPYGFDAGKLRAARTAAGASVARIAREVGVSERAVSLYLAGSRVPRPELLPRLARAVGVSPADLCTVEQERLVHLRVFAGRSRAEMARALGIAEETGSAHKNGQHFDIGSGGGKRSQPSRNVHEFRQHLGLLEGPSTRTRGR
ncbi:helix-turn-helix domain-containing protein [Kitasatospora aureofaciens]|uniref:helix-turn-helix domain-containing protein n=1 Tax=Kitasatospora aureofaciens TaxID=1894 RepID=UPI0036F49E59